MVNSQFNLCDIANVNNGDDNALESPSIIDSFTDSLINHQTKK